VTPSVAEVEVRIVLPSDEVEHSENVRARAETTLVDIIEELSLPIAPPSASVEMGDRLAMTINGVPCELPTARFLVRHTSSLEDRIVYAIHVQARLLVTSEVTRAVWSTVSGSTDSAAPPWFHGLVRDLVHHRVRPARLASLPGVGADADADALFESALSAAGRPCRITVDECTAQTVTEDRKKLRGLMTYLATGLSEELGLPIAVPRIDVDTALPEHHFAVEVGDLRVPPMPGIGPDQILVNDTAERLGPSMSATAVTNPVTGQPAALAPASLADELQRMGLTTWDMVGYVVLGAAEIIRRHAGTLYRLELLRYQLDRLAADHPMLGPMVEAVGGIHLVMRVLRRLVGEGVPVHNLPKIISTLYRAAPPPPAEPGRMSIATRQHRVEVVGTAEIGNVLEASLAETARVAASPAIVYKYARGTTTLVVYLLDVEVENRLRDPAELTATERRALLDMVANEISYLPPTAQIPVLLTRSALRARLRSVIATEQPKLAVVAHEELSGGLNVQPVARLSL
jgi:flagellar biosynthesis component FlhA